MSATIKIASAPKEKKKRKPRPTKVTVVGPALKKSSSKSAGSAKQYSRKSKRAMRTANQVVNPVGGTGKSRDLAQLEGLVTAAENKAKAALVAFEQVVNPSDKRFLVRLCPSGTGAATVQTHLACMPLRTTVDMTNLLANGADLPVLRGGETEARTVWSMTDKCVQFVLTDDPLVPLIAPALNVIRNAVYLLDKWFAPNQDASGEILTLSQAKLSDGVICEIPVCGTQLSNNGGVYGNHHPIGMALDGKFYFWVDASPLCPCEVSAVVQFHHHDCTTSALTLMSARYNAVANEKHFTWTRTADSPVEPVVNDMQAYTLTLGLNNSGYYTFWIEVYQEVTADGGYAVMIPGTFGVKTTCGVVSRHYVNEALSDLEDAISGIRVNGTSLLLTNTTANFYKGGRVIGYSASETHEVWYDLTGAVPTMMAASEELVYNDAWSKGIYGYVKTRDLGKFVETMGDFNNGKTINGDFADPYGFSIFNVYPALSDTASITTNIVVHQAIEMRTTNPVFNLQPPRMTAESYNLLVESLLRMPAPFSCNPGHLEWIKQNIISVAKFAQSVLDPVVHFATSKGVPLLKILSGAAPLSGALELFGF